MALRSCRSGISLLGKKEMKNFCTSAGEIAWYLLRTGVRKGMPLEGFLMNSLNGRKRWLLLLLTVAVLGILACRKGEGGGMKESLFDGVTLEAAQPPTQEGSETIVLGIEYINPREDYPYQDLARIFAHIGIRATKLQSIDWEMVEPRKPRKGVHEYQWELIDNLIKTFQSEGYNNIHCVLQAASPWGVQEYRAKSWGESAFLRNNPPSMPPKPEHWGDYTDFVRQVVERYDKDGTQDMPGLLYPIIHYEIETEAQGTFRWRGSTGDYIKLLDTAYKAAKKADSKAQIILSGLFLGDVVREDEGETERRLAQIKDPVTDWKAVVQFNQEIFKRKDLFDIVEYHDLNDYKETYHAIKWIREQMKKNGYSKPIWAGDACSVPTLHLGPVTPHPTPFGLVPREILKVLRDKRHPEYQEKLKWYRAEQANLVVKKTVAGMELGLSQINFGFFQDHPKAYRFGGRFLTALMPAVLNWWIGGFLNADLQPYPVFYTYDLVIKKLRSASFVKRLDLGSDIYGFEFSTPNKPLYVLWSEEKRETELPVNSPQVRLTRIFTEFDQRDKVELLAPVKGKLRLSLSSNPFFIEPL